MGGLGLLAILITGCNAFFDETSDYWYSNNDGIFLDDSLSLNSGRYDNETLPYDTLKSLAETHRALHMQINGDTRRRKQGSALPKGISWPAAKKECALGTSTKIFCNNCVCMAPQVYVCTSNICPITTLRSSKCVHGTKFETRDCNKCRCIHGHYMCSLLSCPLERRVKELKKLKSVAIEKDGVQCTPGHPVGINSCNICMCHELQLFCTVMLCKDHKGYVQLKGPRKPPKPERCVAGTWYSPIGSRTCRPCYCLNEHVSFCFPSQCDMGKQDNYYNADIDLYVSPRNTCKGNRQPMKRGRCTSCHCRDRSWKCTRDKKCDSKSYQEKRSFTLGTRDMCNGCKYKLGVWECFGTKAPCADYTSIKKKSHTFFINDKSRCSTCYSDPVAGNICATDSSCSKKHKLKAKLSNKCDQDRCVSSCFSRWRGGAMIMMMPLGCIGDRCVCY